MKMNKRAETTEIIWIISLFVYFIVFITITTGVISSQIDQNNYNSSLKDADLSAFTSDHICDNPRYKYSSDGDITEYSSVGRDRLFCDESYGVKGKTECNEIDGCLWTNTTTIDFSSILRFCFLGGDCTQEYYYCSGVINSHHYGVENRSVNAFIYPRVAYHDTPFGFWSTVEQSLTFQEPSPCTHPNVLYNKTTCEIFSCSWVDYDFAEEMNKVSSIRLAMGTMLSFRAPFGFKNDKTFGFILQGLFVWMPLLIFIIAVLKLIRS